jgi:Phospholipase_D-nuclease N-terminal
MRAVVFLALADLALLVVGLIDCLSVEAREIRVLPRLVWAILIVLFSPVGPIAWFVSGRPARPASVPTPAYTRTTFAPDDDPDFLKSLDTERRRPNDDDSPPGAP